MRCCRGFESVRGRQCPDEIILDDRYYAGINGIPDAAIRDAMRLAARLKGWSRTRERGEVDGRSRGHGCTPRNREREQLLYAHLRGQPTINAYASLFS